MRGKSIEILNALPFKFVETSNVEILDFRLKF